MIIEGQGLDIWITWCRREAACRYCAKPIPAGSPMVRGKWWKKQDGSAARWCFPSYWHPNCWLEEGLQYLKQHPYVPKAQGRKPLDLEPELKLRRNRLLMKRARTMYQLRAAIDNGGLTEAQKNRYLARLLNISIEMETCGGCPSKWFEEPAISTV